MSAQVAALTDKMATGAIVNTGALPRDVTAWSELAGKSRTRTTGRMSIGSVDWLLSTAAAEEAAAMRAKNATLQAAWDATKRNASAEMLEWFTSRGGQLSFVRPVNDSTLADGSIAPELLEVRGGVAVNLCGGVAVFETLLVCLNFHGIVYSPPPPRAFSTIPLPAKQVS